MLWMASLSGPLLIGVTILGGASPASCGVFSGPLSLVAGALR